jgi:hypothetical protein
MMDAVNTKEEPILDMLKALADASRLNLLRILNEGERTVGDLAQTVALTEPTVSHHLAKLREVGLVTLRMAGNQRFYKANPSGLERFKRLAGEIEQMPPAPEPPSDNRWIDALGWDEFDTKVLRDYTVNARLTQIPLKPKKLDVILRWLATLFEQGRLYTEPEVNEVIKSAYAHDYASLRREMIGFGYLRRERGGSKYWLTPDDERIPDSYLHPAD